MANDFNIACTQCKHCLDVGTHHGIYFASEIVMEELNNFLFEHQGHKLLFEDAQFFETEEEPIAEHEDDEEYRPNVYRYTKLHARPK